MQRTGMRWFHILAGVALIFFYSCGGGGSNEVAGPVADAGPNNTIIMGQMVALNGSGSSTPVGVITSYQWEQLAGTPVTLSDNTVANPTFQSPDNVALTGEVLQFQLTVTDDRLLTNTDTVDITVLWGAADDFTDNTLSEYATDNVYLSGPPPPPPFPEFNYDSIGKRVQVLTGDDVGLIFSRDFPAPTVDNGVFSFDFYPTQTFPSHGGVWARLMQNDNTYYEMAVFDWGVVVPFEFPYFAKVIDGVTVDNVAFTNNSNYVSQDPPTLYPVSITITPAVAILQGFGETIVLNSDSTPVDIVKFEIQTNQQNAFYDNLEFILVP